MMSLNRKKLGNKKPFSFSDNTKSCTIPITSGFNYGLDPDAIGIMHDFPKSKKL